MITGYDLQQRCGRCGAVNVVMADGAQFLIRHDVCEHFRAVKAHPLLAAIAVGKLEPEKEAVC
jgi:hypothetical protein